MGQRKSVEWTDGGVQAALGDVQITGGGAQVMMPQQELDGAQIGASIEKMASKRMPQYVGTEWLGHA